MEIMQEIYDPGFPSKGFPSKIREASRIIAVDSTGSIGLIYSTKLDYYKLPGGGIEKGETKEEALIRETMEEIGCEVKIEGFIGQINEYRSAKNFGYNFNQKQISYCYWGKVISKGHALNLSQKELDEGFETVWLPLNEALKSLEKKSKKNIIKIPFINKRDRAFLKKFKEETNYS